MKEFTIPAHIPEDFDEMYIEGKIRENNIYLVQSGIEGVSLDGEALVEIVRKGHCLIEPLRDAYVEEATGHIARGNKMLLDRLEQASNEELKTYLRSHIDRNQSNLLKAKGAFYTPQHDLYMALCSGIPATITILFADARMDDDENLLEALRAIEKPVDISQMLSTAGINPEQIRERNAVDPQGGPDGH